MAMPVLARTPKAPPGGAAAADDYNIQGEKSGYSFGGVTVPYTTSLGSLATRKARFEQVQLDFERELKQYQRNRATALQIAIQKNMLVHTAQMCIQLGKQRPLRASRHANLNPLFADEPKADRRKTFYELPLVLDRIRHRACDKVGLRKIGGGPLHDVSDAGKSGWRRACGLA